MRIVVKVILSAIIIVAISELSKRSNFLAGTLASLPIISILAFIWLYTDTKDVEQVASLASSILWLVIPSLVLFIALPIMLRKGVGFYQSLFFASCLTSFGYFLMIKALKYFGLNT